ncbi:MAG: hypothetical protein APF84_08495 [Gracilibacter sp. BRH_c7a]|nr:MAG: hypothetical protein APF84_08495 [Gracilibacter sp. BRH_c7a]
MRIEVKPSEVYSAGKYQRTATTEMYGRLAKKCGYPEDYNLNCYLEHLANKFLENDLPHEVGIFLGYPLKDVLGYIGHSLLKLAKIKGWNYYRDISTSEIKYEDFRSAKIKVRNLIGQIAPDYLWLSANKYQNSDLSTY